MKGLIVVAVVVEVASTFVVAGVLRLVLLPFGVRAGYFGLWASWFLSVLGREFLDGRRRRKDGRL